MSPMPDSSARDFALVSLDWTSLPGWKSNEMPPNKAHSIREPSDGRDRALAERIIRGTVKNLLLLQHLVSHYSGRSPKSIDPLVQKILAIGLYQLRFLDRVPASAVVDEAVEQTRRFGRSKASGFVNAILRRATREPNPPLPDRKDARRFANIVLSHPLELVDRLIESFGADRALEFCEHNNAEPPTIVRLFAGHGAEELSAEGVTVTPHEQGGSYVVEPAKVPLLADWAARAVAQVQDPTASLVADECDIHPGHAVLDRCAGMGTKTLQLQEKLGEEGSILAMDASAVRCEALASLLQARGLSNVKVQYGNFLRGEHATAFDRVLVDAPCSNSGVLARRPEARFAQDRDSLRSLRHLQMDILADTAPSVRPGGLLIYSTCSIWREENEGLAEEFLEKHPEFTRIGSRTTLPTSGTDPRTYRDGGFTAQMRRH